MGAFPRGNASQAAAQRSVPTWELPVGFRPPACFTWNFARTSTGGSVPTWERGSGVGRADGFTSERGQDGGSLTGRDTAPYSGYRQEGLGSGGGWVQLLLPVPHPGLRPPPAGRGPDSTNGTGRGAGSDREIRSPTRCVRKCPPSARRGVR